MTSADYDVAAIMGGLYGDGIIGLKGAFTSQWADRLREDIAVLFAEATAVPGGTLPRGPERYYVEVQPERIRGFADRRTPSVLFSLLRPGAHIPPHFGMLNCRLICHLQLIVPPACWLRVGNETRE